MKEAGIDAGCSDQGISRLSSLSLHVNYAARGRTVAAMRLACASSATRRS
jgi:hypothetical protein